MTSWQCLNKLLTWCSYSSRGMALSTCNTMASTSSQSLNSVSANSFFSLANSHLSHKLRSGEYGGCQIVEQPLFLMKSFTLADTWGRALSYWIESSESLVGSLRKDLHRSPASQLGKVAVNLGTRKARLDVELDGCFVHYKVSVMQDGDDSRTRVAVDEGPIVFLRYLWIYSFDRTASENIDSPIASSSMVEIWAL